MLVWNLHRFPEGSCPHLDLFSLPSVMFHECTRNRRCIMPYKPPIHRSEKYLFPSSASCPEPPSYRGSAKPLIRGGDCLMSGQVLV